MRQNSIVRFTALLLALLSFSTAGKLQLYGSTTPELNDLSISAPGKKTDSPATAPGKDAQIINVQTFGAKGDGTANDTAAINTALAAAINSKTPLFFPAGDYLIAGTGAQILLVTTGIEIYGAGQKAARLKVAASTGSSTDIVVFKPTTAETDSRGFHFHDLSIVPASGSPGRHALVLNCANAWIANAHVHDAELGALGGRGLVLTNPAPVADGIFTSGFDNLLIWNGIQLYKAGDSLRFNNVTTAGENDIELDFASGASNFYFGHGNITLKGGIHVKSGYRVTFDDCNIEIWQTGARGSNGAVVDVDGTSGAAVKYFTLINSSVRSLNANALDGVRFNWVEAPYIENLDVNVPASKNLFKITPNASDGISLGEFQPSGPGTAIDNSANRRIYYKPRLFSPSVASKQPGYVAVEGVLVNTMSLGWVETTSSGSFANNQLVAVNATGGNKTWTLPGLAASGLNGSGKMYGLMKTDSTANTVTLTANGTDTINGAPSITLSKQYKYVWVVAGTGKWFIWGQN